MKKPFDCEGTAMQSLMSSSASNRTNPRLDSSPEDLVASWLEKLLQHFGLRDLDISSDHKLAALLADCGEDNLSILNHSAPLAELKRRIIRLAGAQLDSAFISMAPNVIDEADIERITLSVEARHLEGLRHQGEVYRLLEAFAPCHRLQAFCLGQTLSEQMSPYLITRSDERFAVWINIRALPQRSEHKHLSSSANINDLGR
ncbi:MAG: hypothetical protein WA885_02675 [Phormidesmis sp.]